MIHKVSITIFHDGNDLSWPDIEKFSQGWNERHSSLLQNVMDINFTIALDKEQAEYTEFMEWLSQFSMKENIIYESNAFILYEQEDYQRADFIQLSGVRPPDGFLVNGGQAFGDGETCEVCGYTDPWPMVQRERLIIDERRLDKEDKAIHFFNLDNGGLLISKKAIDLLFTKYGKGLSLKTVVGLNGQDSELYFQAGADRVILSPDLEKTKLSGYICPKCGVVHGEFQSALYFKKGDVGDLDVFSRHPNHCAMLFFRKGMVDLLEQHGIPGFSMDLPVYIS